MSAPLPLTSQDILALKTALHTMPYAVNFCDVQDMSHHHQGHTFHGWHLKVTVGCGTDIPLLTLHKAVYRCLQPFQDSIHSVHIARVKAPYTPLSQDTP